MALSPFPPAQAMNASNRPGKRMHVFSRIWVRRECWTLSLRAKLLLFLIVICLGWLTFRSVYRLLAVTVRVPAEVLLVEGWLPGYALENAVAEYEAGGYAYVITTGGYTKDGWLKQSNRTYADYSSSWLVKLGIPARAVRSVPCLEERQDRTYHCAVTVSQWLKTNGLAPKSVNVITLGPHARRSKYLCQMAFGREIKIGVIAIEDRAYDSVHWWRSSEGVREVIGEVLAYGYARLFFVPPLDGLAQSD